MDTSRSLGKRFILQTESPTSQDDLGLLIFLLHLLSAGIIGVSYWVWLTFLSYPLFNNLCYLSSLFFISRELDYYSSYLKHAV